MGQLLPGDSDAYLVAVACPDISELERAYVADAMLQGQPASGPYVERFERKFAAWQGYRHCVSACNGTAALQLALAAMGIGAGDEVIVPSLTYAATAATVVHAGASPVFVDSGADGTLCAADVARAITPHTRLVIPVHLYGVRAELEHIADLGVPLLVDAAEGHGIDNGGHVAAYSFYANKIITTGEGGAVCCDDPELADRLRHLRNHAQTEYRYWHDAAGFNFRMSNMAAALGCAQVERADDMVARRFAILEEYGKHANIAPCDAPWVARMICDDPLATAERLSEARIETRRAFYPVHTMPPYRRYRYAGLGHSEGIGATTLCLPLSSTLTEADVDLVCRAIGDCNGES